MTLFDDDIENSLRALALNLRAATGHDDFIVTFTDDLRGATLVVGEDLDSYPIEGEVLDAINDAVEEITEAADRTLHRDAPTSYWLQSRGVVEYRLTYGTSEQGSITLP